MSETTSSAVGEQARDPTAEARHKTLEALTLLWQSLPVRKVENKSPILVDLMHGHVEFLLRGLVVAKFVQSIAGGRLIGLIGAPGVVASSSPPRTNINLELAAAFGIEEVVDASLGEAAPRDGATLERLMVLAINDPGTRTLASRIALATDVEDGFPIGRILQETYMRAELQATVRTGPLLGEWASRVVAFDRWIRELLRQRAPAVFVTGHIDYSPWGHLAERLVRSGGRIVWYRCDNRIPVHFIDDVDPSGTLHETVRRADALAFVSFEREIRKSPELLSRWEGFAKQLGSSVRRGHGRNWRWVRPPDKPASHRQLGSRPRYVAFAHTFTDLPASDRSLFVDYYDWLDSTLAYARSEKSFEITVKWHPLDAGYDLSGASQELSERYAATENISFTRESMPLEQLARMFDAGITVRGTPGIEMTALGLPMILAGDAQYSDCGFCIVPKTRDEYFALLARRTPPNLDIAEQAKRAELYQAFDRFWSAPASPLCPAFSALIDDEAFWKRLADGVNAADVVTDHLGLALRRAWPVRNAKVIAVSLEAAVQLMA